MKWSGRGLLTNPNKREFSWPVRQLANLCRIAKTRYRYIQTNEELVACCFTKSLGGGDNDWQAAIKPIPWSKHGEDVLTTDLALWWLCMLAMSPQSRAVVDKSEMIDINAWEVVEYPDERGWVRRHHYSNVEQPTEPPPPGNPAAFDAGAGINQSCWATSTPPTTPTLKPSTLTTSSSSSTLTPSTPTMSSRTSKGAFKEASWVELA